MESNIEKNVESGRISLYNNDGISYTEEKEPGEYLWEKQHPLIWWAGMSSK